MMQGALILGCVGFITLSLGSQEGGLSGQNSVTGHESPLPDSNVPNGQTGWKAEDETSATRKKVNNNDFPWKGSDSSTSNKNHRHRHHHDDDGFGRHRNHQHHPKHMEWGKSPGLGRWGPYFEDTENATSLPVPLGGSVDLNCRVGMLHDKTVMWLRRSGDDRVSLLTVGDTVYSSDTRVSLRYQYPNNWRLHISPVKRPDEGTYFCQLSTHPPRAIYRNITVLAPDLNVVDEHGHSVHDRYYKTGSTIELTCRVTNVMVPSHVVWTKDDDNLPDKITTTGISDVTTAESQSRLVVPRVTAEDSGTYACSISEFSFVEVHVHVLNGEKQAAVQHDSWSSSKACIAILPKFWLNFIIIYHKTLRKIISMM